MRRRVILVGNPNVGKSTIFNALTGLKQHTGNWAGVTVSYSCGIMKQRREPDGCSAGGKHTAAAKTADAVELVDLPGIYSFDTRSEEEAVTRSFVEQGDYDILLLICDATCLERGLHLFEQAVKLRRPDSCDTPQLILCVNLCDEAARSGIIIDFRALEEKLRVPVIPCCARDAEGLDALRKQLSTNLTPAPSDNPQCEEGSLNGSNDSSDASVTLTKPDSPDASVALTKPDSPATPLSASKQASPAELASHVVTYADHVHRKRRQSQEALDRFLTSPVTGSFCMILFLIGILWLTISGSNLPSGLLWDLFFRLETRLAHTVAALGAPDWFLNAFVFGVYRVVAWVVSVMLPPMAIFFPLFTLLEDYGYLPRIAYNMDGVFHSCSACGKQCLTMAMGLGCNAVGVTGCRIIDSPRERLIAILTNSLVPCNGRFPLLITMISFGIMGLSQKAFPWVTCPWMTWPWMTCPWAVSLLSAVLLAGFILLGIAATLLASQLLSKTVLKGHPSSFTLELPPFRRPQIKKVMIRSIFDRTLFVLGRAVIVAAPAGLLIWAMANLSLGGTTALAFFSGLLDPIGRFMGLDGVILMAFILGFPANEIVLPIILMAYLQNGYLIDMEETSALFALLSANGWTFRTFLCMALFSLFHWPCSTTCLTIRRETGSWKWTGIAIAIPTILGFSLCSMVSFLLPS